MPRGKGRPGGKKDIKTDPPKKSRQQIINIISNNQKKAWKKHMSPAGNLPGRLKTGR